MIRITFSQRSQFQNHTLLFLISDVFLAWNRFVRPFTWSSVAVLSCYWAGQALLAVSYLARFIRRPLFR